MIAPKPSNLGEIAYWNGPAGERWAEGHALTDRALLPFGRAAVARAAFARGERVLDVGCGAGATTLEIAAAVGPEGHVLGVDVSAPMLAVARKRAADLQQVAWLEADASAHPFDPTRDVAFSRFGVMFFADPRVGFANVRTALRPGGRLAFVCWRSLADNPWMSRPVDALAPLLPPAEPTPKDAPGPLALADPARTRTLLSAAGFAGVSLEPFDADFVFSEDGVPSAVSFAMRTGPAARRLNEADDGVRARGREALTALFASLASAGRVALPGGAWLVTARNA